MRYKLLGAGFAVGIIVTPLIVISTISMLIGHFEHEGLGFAAKQMRWYIFIELFIVATCSIAITRPGISGVTDFDERFKRKQPTYALGAILFAILFNPFSPFHLNFWSWQVLDWAAILFLAFCNLMYFEGTQDISNRDYILKRASEESHGSAGR